jgi:hypothetical protein
MSGPMRPNNIQIFLLQLADGSTAPTALDAVYPVSPFSDVVGSVFAFSEAHRLWRPPCGAVDDSISVYGYPQYSSACHKKANEDREVRCAPVWVFLATF